MFHYPSGRASQGSNGNIRRADVLNATQQRPSTNPIFLKIEEELHDARRVHSDGQEDDLRYALNMVINRVTELSSMLSEAYKAQAELEVQLNVTKSNLKLVIANNEMLEDALKQNTTQSKDVGWRRTSTRQNGELPSDPRATLERSQSVDLPVTQEPSTPQSAGAASTTGTTSQDNRFFKFRFSTGPSAPAQKPNSNTRPGTPVAGNPGASTPNLTSPSMPSLSSVKMKEVEDLTAELEKEKAERKKIVEEKAALEDELESLSQALFEEANKMVSDERKARAEVEDELKELKAEKEALRSALRVIEGENTNFRSVNASALPSPQPPHSQQSSTSSTDLNTSPTSTPTPTENLAAQQRVHTRSSSEIAIKSRPQSLNLSPTFPPLPPSEPASPSSSSYYEGLPGEEDVRLKNKGSLFSPDVTVLSPEDESQPTPRFGIVSDGSAPPTTGGLRTNNGGSDDDMYLGSSAWADIPSVWQPPKSAPATSRTVPSTLAS
ncbi:hypothetical protein CPB83DRAFT_794228 [Crepidotus variabilis]|uniref:GDP/GTP exchange factor Sec2 N-terminal domain-containing protein n=1 Tax=Crepidotus variabilis TaxID=179855 RepID=A0A9P6EDB6_9AGAR|nr:hypothetical protein CPB83DRAFT_794228 [Crepidotus variabilis]